MSDAGSTLGSEDAEDCEQDAEVTTKSDWWTSQLTLRRVLAVGQFGVAEHRALLHQKKLAANSVKYPDDIAIEGDPAKLNAYLLKMTRAKKISVETVTSSTFQTQSSMQQSPFWAQGTRQLVLAR